jgi:hypothetical protein
VTLTAPTDGSVVTGQVDLSAVVDDDAPLARFEFLVDSVPVAAPLSAAPYVLAWDSTTANPSAPHTISARATDALGRSNVSALLTVQVDNGPRISAMSIGPGLTATSMRVSWTTSVLADAQVEFGPTPAYGASTPVDRTPDWHHTMQLTGLVPGVQYHYRVRSRDGNGALAVSPDQTFFTQPQQ